MKVVMKKYVVAKGYRIFKPDVVKQFDSKEDAEQFAKLMEKTNPGTEYAVYEHCTVELEGVYERKPDLIDFR